MNIPNQHLHAGLNLDLWDFADLLLKNRFAQALTDGIARYPVHRVLRFAARVELEPYFDALALREGERSVLVQAQ